MDGAGKDRAARTGFPDVCVRGGGESKRGGKG